MLTAKERAIPSGRLQHYQEIWTTKAIFGLGKLRQILKWSVAGRAWHRVSATPGIRVEDVGSILRQTRAQVDGSKAHKPTWQAAQSQPA